jgi:hypothetical protein
VFNLCMPAILDGLGHLINVRVFDVVVDGTRLGLVDQRELRQASPRSLSAVRNSTMLTNLYGALLSVLTTSHFHTSDRKIIRRSIPSG